MAIVLVRIRVGTSGYSYFWNECKPSPFEWYVQQGFNTVEINVSFYRFPVQSWIKTWMHCPEDFDFSVKVHRSITHCMKLRGRAFDLWRRFIEPFKEMEGKITFWLFQFPPGFKPTEKSVCAVTSFFSGVSVGRKAALEFRDGAWWVREDMCKDIDAVFCSVDAPTLPRKILNLNDSIYLRLHGRQEWYNYEYSDKEICRLFKEVKMLKAFRKHIYLNNDHDMLPNGKLLLKLAGVKSF
jgi:uncharacterized protein YecE (DUF72 family)